MDKLLSAAAQAATRAYAPYSGFAVGAAVELSDATIITGNNQECSSSSLTICAERVALATAMAANPKAVVLRVAIYSQNSPHSISPCGACREFIAQVANRCGVDIEIIGVMPGKSVRISELLPLPFVR